MNVRRSWLPALGVAIPLIGLGSTPEPGMSRLLFSAPLVCASFGCVSVTPGLGLPDVNPTPDPAVKVFRKGAALVSVSGMTGTHFAALLGSRSARWQAVPQ